MQRLRFGGAPEVGTKVVATVAVLPRSLRLGAPEVGTIVVATVVATVAPLLRACFFSRISVLFCVPFFFLLVVLVPSASDFSLLFSFLLAELCAIASLMAAPMLSTSSQV